MRGVYDARRFACGQAAYVLPMFAIVPYLLLGLKVALAELLAELLIGLVVLGGGGPRRARVVLRAL